MIVEVKVPSPGESITEVQLASWLVSDGDQVEKDVEIAEIDSDKATLTISAEASGKISLKAAEGDSLDVGAVIAEIDTEAIGKTAEGKRFQHIRTVSSCHKLGHVLAGGGTGFKTKISPSAIHIKAFKK